MCSLWLGSVITLCYISESNFTGSYICYMYWGSVLRLTANCKIECDKTTNTLWNIYMLIVWEAVEKNKGNAGE